MTITDILKVVPTIQSAAIAGVALKTLKKKKKKSSDLVKLGATAIVGSALIKTESDFIGGI